MEMMAVAKAAEDEVSIRARLRQVTQLQNSIPKDLHELFSFIENDRGDGLLAVRAPCLCRLSHRAGIRHHV